MQKVELIRVNLNFVKEISSNFEKWLYCLVLCNYLRLSRTIAS